MAIFHTVGGDPRLLVSPTMAQHEEGNPNRDFDVASCYSSGVVGQDYFPDNLRQIEKPPRVFSLVPEPENSYDQNAVAVYVKSLQIGYIPATSAKWLHGVVAAKIAESGECLVPASQPKPTRYKHILEEGESLSDYVDFDDPTCIYKNFSQSFDPEWDETTVKYTKQRRVGIAWLPTFQAVRYLTSEPTLYEEFNNLWDELSQESKDDIRKNGWRLGHLSRQELQEIGRKRNTYSFPVAPPSTDSLYKYYLVHHRRHIHNRLTEIQRAKRNITIIERVNAGETRTSIADKVGLSPGTVSDIYRKGTQGKLELWKEQANSFPATEQDIKSHLLQRLYDEDDLSPSSIESWLKKYR